MRNTIAICILVVGLGVFGAWLYVQPGKAVQGVKTALDQNDPAQLAPWLDLPALRSNIANRQTAKLPGASNDGPAGLLGLFGQALADMMIGAAVQGVATPEGLLALLRGAAASAPVPEGAQPRTPSERLFARARTELSGFDRYIVTAPLKAGTELKLVFFRQGTNWRLSDLEIATASGDRT